MKIVNAGIYTIVSEGNAESKIAIEDSTIPPINSKFTGIYIEKNQSFEIPSGVTVKFFPVTFDNLGKKEDFNLNALGTYFVGGEIYPGRYRVSLKENKTDDQLKVQLIILNKKKEHNLTLDKNNTQGDIQLKKGDLLNVKSYYLNVDLNFEKIK